jgi:hypothetical protein
MILTRSVNNCVLYFGIEAPWVEGSIDKAKAAVTLAIDGMILVILTLRR